MRTIKRLLAILTALITSVSLAAAVPVPLLPEAGCEACASECPPVVVEKFPNASRALIIDDENTTVVVFCGTGTVQTITRGEKKLIILFAHCTKA